MRWLGVLFPGKTPPTGGRLVWGLAWRLLAFAIATALFVAAIWAEYVDKDQANSTSTRVGEWVGAGLFYAVVALILTSPIWAPLWLFLWWRSRRRQRAS